jgi:hypothetical protein
MTDTTPPATGATSIDSEREWPNRYVTVHRVDGEPATLADLDRLLANVFERWRLIQDLANTNPHTFGSFCRYCRRDADLGHRDGCMWVRANRLTDETARP